VAIAREQQITTFVETFYSVWNQKTLQNRTDYFDSVNAGDLAAGLPLGTIPPGAIPSFEQLTGGSATRTSGGATSAGAVIANAQAAQNPGANPQNPPNFPLLQPLNLNPTGNTVLANLTARVNAEVNALTQVTLPGVQSQAVNPGNVNIGSLVQARPTLPQLLADDGSFSRLETQRLTGTTPGAFAADDAARSDAAQNRTILRQRIDTLYGTDRQIPNQENVLQKYENYTYQLSWYLAPPSSYNRFGNYRNLSNYYLLAQSGGASGVAGSVQSSQGVDATGSLDTAVPDVVSNASRNPFFDVDFFIDNLDITTRFPLAGTRMSHSNTEISFTVTEPYGLSLIPRLQNAIEDLYKQAGIFTRSGARYSSAVYLMVIKFWGIKSDGTLERVISSPGNGGSAGPVEKYIPFLIRELRFSQGSRFVEYRITGNPPFTYIGFGRERGVLLDRYTLTGRTVKDALSGQTAATGTAAADTAAQGRTVTSSATDPTGTGFDDTITT
jgi:hypothetical protein